MARYHITALNYINVGSKRAFFNFDSKLSYDIPGTAYLLSTESVLTCTTRDDELPGGSDEIEPTGVHDEDCTIDYGDIRTESEYSVVPTDYISKEDEDKAVSKENDVTKVILCERQNTVD